ncbi:unnamed protein product [Rotaria sp. Silwood1]|nr:unnamed protein product [Rotaria sp. Silwood1]
MQAITPVDIHIENERQDGSNIEKYTKTSTRRGRQIPRMHTRVTNKTKTKKIKTILSPSSHIPKQIVIPKLVLPRHSQSSSLNREPWVPAPGRSTKGQKVSWLNTKSHLEINPVTEFTIDDEDSWNIEHDKYDENIKLMTEIQNYERRIQKVIEDIGTLKEFIHKHTNYKQTNQLRSNIDSSLFELERFQQNYAQYIKPNSTSKILRSKSLSPIRNYNTNTNNNNNRSSSLDELQRRQNLTSKVSFYDDPIIERRKVRNTTPIRGPIHLNPDREQLLITLADSEVDIAQITKKLSSLTDILRKLKFHLLNTKTYESPSINKQNDWKKTDFKIRDDIYGSKERFLPKDTFDLEQQIARLRLEYTQLKQEKDELERRFTSQLTELRDKLEQSNNNNRSMQNYINSIKTAYTTLFNDTLPTSLTRYTTT